jgi:hypothetical protein
MVVSGRLLMQNAEATPKSGAAIVQKTWADRLNDEPELESDADEQLLMYIPYVSTSITST